MRYYDRIDPPEVRMQKVRRLEDYAGNLTGWILERDGVVAHFSVDAKGHLRLERVEERR